MLLKAFKKRYELDEIKGIILLSCVIVALVIGNSALSVPFNKLLAHRISFEIGNIGLNYTILHWINDGLMSIFFFMVGLEVKRELMEGELSLAKKAALPVCAALGGMLVPAIIYVLLNLHKETIIGWGVPMATDIAFSLGILALLSRRTPSSLKIFLSALAIIDDLGAVLVIAFFYTNTIHFTYLLGALAMLAILVLLNVYAASNWVFYIIPGIFLWHFMGAGGVHPTLAGILVAFAIPLKPTNGFSPLKKLEHVLEMPVNYMIIPLFVLANAPIALNWDAMDSLGKSSSLGILLGLTLGKPFGISAFSWAAVKLGFGLLPSGSNWKHIIGLGMLAGVGFTMAMFIAMLAFDEPHIQETAKLAILIASSLSGLIGAIFLSLSKRNLKQILKN